MGLGGMKNGWEAPSIEACTSKSFFFSLVGLSILGVLVKVVGGEGVLPRGGLRKWVCPAIISRRSSVASTSSSDASPRFTTMIPRPQSYAPTPHSYVPNTNLSATINLDEVSDCHLCTASYSPPTNPTLGSKAHQHTRRAGPSRFPCRTVQHRSHS